MAKKTALHEILAVIGDLKGAKDKISLETLKVFKDKANLFKGQSRTLKMFDEKRSQEETSEHTELVTTVMKRLEYMKQSYIRFWDAKLQKEKGAQNAKGDIVVGDDVLAEDVPVYLLLEMENELKAMRNVYDNIPTLAPGVDWTEAPDIGENIWKARHDVVVNKTEKAYRHNVIVPPTDKHPAQVREWTEDVPVGQYSTKQWSGMMSPAEKSQLIERLDRVIRAVKKARQRANSQELEKASFATKLFSYIHDK